MGCKSSKEIKKEIKEFQQMAETIIDPTSQRLTTIKSELEKKALDLLESTIKDKIKVNQSVDLKEVLRQKQIEHENAMSEMKDKFKHLENSMVRKIEHKPMKDPEEVVVKMDELKI